MMHIPAKRLGKLRLLAVPYLKMLFPAVLSVLGIASLFEMLHHLRHAPPSDAEMSLFGVSFDSHSTLAWIVVFAVTAAALFAVRVLSPGVKDAWNEANTMAEAVK